MVTRRQRVLFGLLALTIGACFWVSGTDKDASGDVVAPLTRAPGQRSAPAASDASASSVPEAGATLALGQLERPAMAVSDQNPFGVKSWYVAPPPPPPPSSLSPPAPTAPPLPFTYAGKFEEEGGRWVVYLVKGEQSFAVSKGDTFDGVYRFDGIKNGNLVIQYLPLSIKQLLPIGADS